MTAPTVITFGCRLNAFESEVMRGHAVAAGLDRAIIVNTCSVTAEAVRQASQAIRKARRENPDARIIVTGCAAQIEPERFAGMAEVDHVIGNAEKLSADTYRSLANAGGERVRVADIMAVRETAPQLIDGFGSRTRAYVQIQNGCDHRCTFCVIPFGRGSSRSVPAGAVVTQVRRLVEAGTAEVVLTGVDITSYGADLPGEMTLGKLVRSVLRLVPELQRLRLSSIDSIEADPALLGAIAEEPRLMPHLHLSLQAGDDMILKRMKRRHASRDTLRFIDTVRGLRPETAFGADVIAGFPTEDDAMFGNTLAHIEACGLTYLHVFPYSARPSTPAARMPQVPSQVVKSRARQLRVAGAARLSRFLAGQHGATTEALIESNGIGRTPQFAEIAVEGNAEIGSIVPVLVTGSTPQRLTGTVTS